MTVDLKNAPPINAGDVNTREHIFGERYRMFNDNYRDQVDKRLTDIYSNAKLLRMDKQLDMTNNVYKTIVKKISRVYIDGVNREFTDKAMTELYKTNPIDKYMKQANVYANAFNDVLMQVAWDREAKNPRFVFRYPHKTKVVLGDNGQPSEVEYFIETLEDGGEKWAYWSDEKHYYKIYVNDESKEEAVEGNDDKVNPYSVLPFVFFQNGFRDGNFFDMFTGGDLIEATLDVSVYNTFKNYMIKWQSFKQVVVQGSNVGAIKGQVLDPSQALTAEGDDIKIDVLDLQANLKELQEVIDTQMTNVAINYNISPNQFRLTGQVSSGFAQQMENAALDSFTTAQQIDFIQYEKDLHKLLITIGNVEGANFSENSELDVSFNEIIYKESAESTIQTQTSRVSLGIDNPVAIIQRENNVDEDEAKEMYAENISLRNKGNENLNAPTLDETTTADAMGITDATT